MGGKQGYLGGCHCGVVRYSVAIEPKPKVISCNCSICSKRGLLLTFVPADDFKLTAGADAMIDYRFNTHKVHHMFCKACGVEAFANGTAPDGSGVVAVNVRCLEGFDFESLEPIKYDGRSL